MTERSAGDAAQVRLIVEQSVEAAIIKLGAIPINKQERTEIPPILRTWGVIGGALLTAGIIAMALWMVTTLNELQVTVARIDERQQSQSGDLNGRFEEVNRRLSRLEASLAVQEDRK